MEAKRSERTGDRVEERFSNGIYECLYDVSVGHKYFSTETTKLPAIFHYEVIIIFPRICSGINRMLEPRSRKITTPSAVIYVHSAYVHYNLQSDQQI